MFWKNLAKKLLYSVLGVVIDFAQALLKKKKDEEDQKEP